MSKDLLNQDQIKIIESKYNLTYKQGLKVQKAEGVSVTLHIVEDDDGVEYIVKPLEVNSDNCHSQKQIMQQFIGDQNIIQLKLYIEQYYLIVMEKADCDLKMYLQKCTDITEKNLYNITNDILKGIHTMHYKYEKSQYWHRDLKPQNIFLFAKNPKKPIKFNKNDSITAKIGDLGSARQVKSAHTKFTKGSRVGTEIYKCPELCANQDNYTQKIDVWSLGIVLFELFSGTKYLNYYSSHRIQCMTVKGCQQILKYMLTKLDQKPCAYTSTIKQMISKSIIHNPDQRATIRQLLQIFGSGSLMSLSTTTVPFIKPSEVAKPFQKQKKSLTEKLDIRQQQIANFHLIQNKIKKFIDEIQKPHKIMDYSSECQDNNVIIMKETIVINLKKQYQFNETILTLYSKLADQIKIGLHFINNGDKQSVIQKQLNSIQNLQSSINNEIQTIQQQTLKSLDLCFLIDGTSSMQPLINDVKNQILAIENQLKNSEEKYKVRFACVVYRDFDCKNKNYQIYDFASGDQLQQYLTQIKAFGGDDVAEDVNGGLQQTLKLKWSSYSKAIIHFLDGPCHQKRFNDLYDADYDNYWEKTPASDISYQKIFRELKSAGIHYCITQIKKLKSISYMVERFKEEHQKAEYYRSATSNLGIIKFVDFATYKNGVVQIVKQLGKDVRKVTKSTIKIKRRLNKTQQQTKNQTPFDKCADQY